MDLKRRVIFLGTDMKKELFGEEDAIGRLVFINGVPFMVVGVMVKKEQDSSYGGRDVNSAFIPSSTFKAMYGREYVNDIVFNADEAGRTESVKRGVYQALGSRYKFDPDDKEALSLWDTTEQEKFFGTFFVAFRVFLGIIGAFTLIVGGIGVSNIMNVVVEERTKEIGIKMALGARSGSILRQFLLETLVLTAVGGAAGILIAAGICAVFPKLGLSDYVGVPTVSVGVAALAAALLGVVGLLAGYFPARDASRLDPVVAMKL